MFTGIIEATAEILNREEGRLCISRPQNFETLMIGQSIAVNGACLSMVKYDEKTMEFDVVPETLARTNLSTAQIVNLERALPAAGRFEGHIVLGHVDSVIQFLERVAEGKGERFVFELPDALRPFVVEKGSVTLNGVSLTIARLNSESFEIAVIPQTLKETNLGWVQKGDRVNFEADIMAKYLKQWTESKMLS